MRSRLRTWNWIGGSCTASGRHRPVDLEAALADLQSEIYGVPASRFKEHAHARAELW